MPDEKRTAAPWFLDLDGVILDVSERYFRAHRAALGPGEHAAEDRAAYWDNKRRRRPPLPGPGTDGAEYLRRWVERVEAPELLREDRVLPGAREQLAALGARRPLVLVTLRQRGDLMRGQLAELGLLSFFAEVLTAAPRGADSWQVKRDLIRGGRLSPEGAVVVGDTEVDVRAGKALGLTTVAVLSGIRDRAALEAERPDYLLPDLAAVGRVLGEAP